MINENDLVKLTKRMYIHALGLVRNTQQAEDISQEYGLRLLEGLHKTATVGQAYIDIRRAEGFDLRKTDSKFHQDKLIFMSQYENIYDMIMEAEDSEVNFTIFSKDILEQFEHLEHLDMLLLKLKGFSNEEVGLQYGVSTQRVYQAVKLSLTKAINSIDI